MLQRVTEDESAYGYHSDADLETALRECENHVGVATRVGFFQIY